MSAFGKALRFTRGLRFRLAFSYVFFFTILLVLLGIVFRQILSATFQSQMESILQEEWGAAKGYLRTGAEGPNWFYDSQDPDETFTVERIRRVYLLGRKPAHRGAHIRRGRRDLVDEAHAVRFRKLSGIIELAYGITQIIGCGARCRGHGYLLPNQVLLCDKHEAISIKP